MIIDITGLIDTIEVERTFGPPTRPLRLVTVRIKEFESAEEKYPAVIPVEFWNKYVDELDEGKFEDGEAVIVSARVGSSPKGFATLRARGIKRLNPGVPADEAEAADDEPDADAPMPF